MESNQELFRQAILDAKAVRETSLASARHTLAEHFEPLVKSMFNETIDSMEEAEQADMKMTQQMKHIREEDMEESKDMEESTLDEILAELDALSDDTMEEGTDLEEGKVTTTAGYDEKAHAAKGNTNGSYSEKAKATHGDNKLHEADDDEDAKEDDKAEEAGEDLTNDMEAGDDMESMGGSDEQEVVDITVGDLKDIIRDVFMQLQGGEQTGALDAGTDLAATLGTDDEDQMDDDSAEISLDEILAELEMEESKMEMEGKKMDMEGKKMDMEEGASLDEIPGGKIPTTMQKYEGMKKELNEAVRTIKALRTELNEMNLFNAKMLYVNKIFKAKNLNEAQKTRVVNAFDRATSVKEVENTFKTLQESISVETKKSSLKESVGFASKAIGNAPARPIVEADTFVTRWQTLAGIK